MNFRNFKYFGFPERVMRALFTMITARIAKNPVVFLSVYIVVSISIIICGFLVVKNESISVYDAYKPKQYNSKSDVVTEIKKSWANYKNKVENNRQTRSSAESSRRDSFNAYLYDVSLKTPDERVNFADSVQSLCQYVYTYPVPQEHDKASSMSEINPEDMLDRQERGGVCKLVGSLPSQFSNISTLNEEGRESLGVLMGNKPFMSELSRKHLGEDYDISKDYISALPPITVSVSHNELSDKWQMALMNDMAQFRSKLTSRTGVKFVYITTAYMTGEELRGIKAEAPKLVACVLLLIFGTIFICLNCSEWRYSRGLMAFAAVLMSIIAVLIGLAVGNMIGLKWMTLLVFVPFLIIGIGCDSAFLLMQQWLLNIEEGNCRTPVELIVATIDGCFLSVTLSDFTAISAFAVGCTTPFLAVNICCAYMALCVLALWLTELLFFVPCLAIKSKIYFLTKASSDQDILKLSNESLKVISDEEFLSRFQTSLSNVSVATTASYSNKTTSQPPNVFNHYERFVMYISNYLTSRSAFRLMWLCLFVFATIISCYNLSIMKSFENNEKYYRDGSPVKEYYTVVAEYMSLGQMGSNMVLTMPTHATFSPNSVHLELQDKQKDPGNAQSGTQILSLISDVDFVTRLKELEADLIETNFFGEFKWVKCIEKLHNERDSNSTAENTIWGENVDIYIKETEAILETCRQSVSYEVEFQTIETEVVVQSSGEEMSQTENVTKLNQTIQSNNNSLQNMDNVNPKLMRVSRQTQTLSIPVIKRVNIAILRNMVKMGDIDKEKAALTQLGRVEKNFVDMKLFFVDWSIELMGRDCLMKPSLWKSVGIAGGCCLFMVTLFIPHYLLIVTVLCMTGLTFVNIMGTMSLAGLTYCPQTYVVSLVAMGMSIDYIAHSGRCFFATYRNSISNSASKGNSISKTIINNEVLQTTMNEISVPLANSALTTILGIVLLSFAESDIFREISYSVIIIFVHSYLNGCFILPVLLHYISQVATAASSSSLQDESSATSGAVASVQQQNKTSAESEMNIDTADNMVIFWGPEDDDQDFLTL